MIASAHEDIFYIQNILPALMMLILKNIFLGQIILWIIKEEIWRYHTEEIFVNIFRRKYEILTIFHQISDFMVKFKWNCQKTKYSLDQGISRNFLR